MLLRRAFLQIFHSLGIVLLHAKSLIEQVANAVAALYAARVGSQLVELERIPHAHRPAHALLVHECHFVERLGIALLG